MLDQKEECQHSAEPTELLTGADKVQMTVETVARKFRALTKVRKAAGPYASRVLAMGVQTNHRLTRVYGRFNQRTRTVELAPWLENDADELRDTFLHEVAHAVHFLAGDVGSMHGSEWKQLAQSLGAITDTSEHVDVVGQAAYKARPKKVVGRCERCDYVFHGRRALNSGALYTCMEADDAGRKCYGDIIHI